MITFLPLRSDLDRLKALAASGRSGCAKAAQAQLQSLTTAALRRAVERKATA